MRRGVIGFDCQRGARSFPKSRDEREDLLEELTQQRVEIVIMTYDALRENTEFQKVKYECVVMNEFPCLKKSGGKRAQAVRNLGTLKRIGLTGTIIQNNFNELWSLLDLVRPGNIMFTLFCVTDSLCFIQERLEVNRTSGLPLLYQSTPVKPKRQLRVRDSRPRKGLSFCVITCASSCFVAPKLSM